MKTLRVTSTLPDDIEALIHKTIGCFLNVHRELGPGMSEGVYSRACRIEVQHQNMLFEHEKSFPIRYRGHLLCHQRIDLIVEGCLVVEIKAVEKIHPVHVAQVLSYLRAPRNRAGLVVNFNVELLKQGVRRVVL